MPQTTEHNNRCRCAAPVAARLPRTAERFHLMAWRYYGLDDVAYEHRTLLAGGPLVMSITAVASALGNRRRRQHAERAAAPQWRPLGPVEVDVRDDRLLVHGPGEPGTVWLASVIDVRVDSEHGIVDLLFERDAPFRFQGGDALRLASALAEVLVVSA